MFLKKFRKIIMLIVTTIVIILLGTFSKAIDEGSAHGDNTLKLEYEYNAEENTVMAKMVSNIELKDTKPSWSLSTDRKTYTKRFTGNMNYETQVEDVNGAIYTVNIVVTQIQPLSIKVSYEYNVEENTVMAKMVSNIELKDTKPTWTLSADKKTYTKRFTGNMNYETQVGDVNGATYTVNIIVTQIQPLSIKVSYEYNAEENTVMAKMVSNIELKDTKPTWTLSEDKKAYTKIFSENNNYSTQVEDVNGEKRNVQINVTDVIIANLKVEYQYDNTRNVVIVKVISDLELKDTKPSWTLSEDKLVYIKEFGDNSR